MSVDVLQNAYVIHSRPYQNTSLLVDFFSEQDGLVRCVAKGYRTPKKSSDLTLFSNLQVMWRGRGDLKTLIRAEPDRNLTVLQGRALFCGFYVNELLLRIMFPGDPHPEVFSHYHKLVKDLSVGESEELVLRQFELKLLEDSGYLVDFGFDIDDGSPIRNDAFYCFEAEKGFSIKLLPDDRAEVFFSGESISAIANGDFSEKQTLRDAKKIVRLMLAPYLGGKPLNSTRLFLR